MSKSLFPEVIYSDWQILSELYRHGTPMTAIELQAGTKTRNKTYKIMVDLVQRDWVRIAGYREGERRPIRTYALTAVGRAVSEAIIEAKRKIFNVLTAQNARDLAAIRQSSLRNFPDTRRRGNV